MSERIVNRTKEILATEELFAKKKFGQNFLIKDYVLEETIIKSGINKDTYVIEIGTGLGSLTEYLALSSKHVLTYDVDSDMYNLAKKNLKDYNNITFILKDILEADLNGDIDKYLDGAKEVVVVANIPYYITTPITMMLLENERVKDIYMMMQEELGVRFCAKPGSRDYSSISALISFQGEAKRVIKVNRNCFYPVPGVDSILLNIKKQKRDYGVNNGASFAKFIRNAFSLKRKTFVNNVASTYPISKAVIEEKLEEKGFSKTIRSEEMDVNSLALMYLTLIGE